MPSLDHVPSTTTPRDPKVVDFEREALRRSLERQNAHPNPQQGRAPRTDTDPPEAA